MSTPSCQKPIPVITWISERPRGGMRFVGRDYRDEESRFVRKLIRFRPGMWRRIEAYQRREFIKKDSEAVFRLIDRGLEAEGIPEVPEKPETD